MVGQIDLKSKSKVVSISARFAIVLWCNGSTKEFESFCPSSNLGKTTKTSYKGQVQSPVLVCEVSEVATNITVRNIAESYAFKVVL